MNHTYQIVGSDGQIYGPVACDELRSWVQQGRVNETTQVFRSDQTAWQPASAFAELGVIPAPGPVPTPHEAPTAARPAQPIDPTTLATTLAPLVNQIRSGAGWFYWIAGLSLVNTIASLSGSEWGFIIGLGVTQVVDALAGGTGGSGKVVALVLDLIVLGVFVCFGYLAAKRMTWAFLVGMVLYALDGLIFVLVHDWPAVGFHVLALFFMFKGLQACRAFHRQATA